MERLGLKVSLIFFVIEGDISFSSCVKGMATFYFGSIGFVRRLLELSQIREQVLRNLYLIESCLESVIGLIGEEIT